MKCLMCLLFGHNWECVEIFPYTDTSFDCNVRSIHYTRICHHCGKIQHGHIYGSSLTRHNKNKLSIRYTD